MKEYPAHSANQVIADSYVEIAKYVARTRAYASIPDGMKAVYRRMLYSSRNLNGKVKSSAIIAECIKYHPHGEAYDVLVSMACKYGKLPLYEGYGNFGGCFTGDTKVDLLDGASVPIKELVDRLEKGESDIWVYSATPEGSIKYGKVLEGHCTGHKEVCYITLDNQEVIKCTLDHEFMLRDGTYKKAFELTPEDNLKTTRTECSISKIEFPGICEDVYDIEVEDYHNFALSAGVFVHNCGFEAAAQRYTSAKLNDIARLMYLELVDYADYVEGDAGEMEPTYLPSLIPYALITGSKGMTVGLPTPNIPSFNIMDLIKYFKAKLQGKSAPYPSIDVGKAEIVNEDMTELDNLYTQGLCKVEYHALLEHESSKVKISSFPPNTRLWKMNDYLRDQIADGVVDYSDTTSNDGMSYEYTLMKPKEMSLSEFTKKFEDKAYSSDSYRMYFEWNSKVYLCSLDKIAQESLAYLKKCAVRKFAKEKVDMDFKVRVLRAIKQLKNSGELSSISTQSSKYYKDLIVSWGFDYEVANSAMSKSINYLTNSHDNELVDLEAQYAKLVELEKDPTEYLLGLYDKLEELVTPLYNSRAHTTYKSKVKPSDLKATYTEDGEFVVTTSGDISYNKYAYVLLKSGLVYKLEIPKVEGTKLECSEFKFSDVVQIVGDSSKSKYLVIRVGKRHLSAIPLDRFEVGVNDVIRPVAHEEFTNLHIISTDSVVVVDDKKTEYPVTELVRGDGYRRLCPLWWGSGHPIVDVRDTD